MKPILLLWGFGMVLIIRNAWNLNFTSSKKMDSFWGLIIGAIIATFSALIYKRG